jgi:hypothetical protein
MISRGDGRLMVEEEDDGIGVYEIQWMDFLGVDIKGCNSRVTSMYAGFISCDDRLPF